MSIDNLAAVRDIGLKPFSYNVVLGASPVPLWNERRIATRWLFRVSADVLIGNEAAQTFAVEAGAGMDGVYLGHDLSKVYVSGAPGTVVRVAGCE